MYSKILVPMALDHGIGARALEVARTLLSADGTITALHVHETPQGSVSSYLDENVVREAFARVKAMMAARVAEMPDVTGIVIKGHSGRSILDYAIQHKTDCIVIGSHKPGLIDYLLGSTATRIVHHAPCAVHVLRT